MWTYIHNPNGIFSGVKVAVYNSQLTSKKLDFEISLENNGQKFEMPSACSVKDLGIAVKTAMLMGGLVYIPVESSKRYHRFVFSNKNMPEVLEFTAKAGYNKLSSEKIEEGKFLNSTTYKNSDRDVLTIVLIDRQADVSIEDLYDFLDKKNIRIERDSPFEDNIVFSEGESSLRDIVYLKDSNTKVTVDIPAENQQIMFSVDKFYHNLFASTVVAAGGAVVRKTKGINSTDVWLFGNVEEIKGKLVSGKRKEGPCYDCSFVDAVESQTMYKDDSDGSIVLIRQMKENAKVDSLQCCPIL